MKLRSFLRVAFGLDDIDWSDDADVPAECVCFRPQLDPLGECTDCRRPALTPHPRHPRSVP